MKSRPEQNEAGQILVLTALALPILIGFLALAVDVGYAYDYKQQMQTAADSAAVTGALLLKSNSSATQTQLNTAARADTSGNGFTHGANGITVTVTKSPAADTTCNATDYSSDTGAVRVSISQAKATFVGSVFGFTSWTIAACGVANAGAPSTTNAVVLDSSGHPALTLSGGAGVTVGGDITVDSTNSGNINISGGSTLTADSLQDVASSCTGTGLCAGITPAPSYNASSLSDPFASQAIPTTSGGSQTVPAACSSGNCTLSQGTYSSITLNHNSFGDGTCATFSSGVYIIDGNFNIQGGQCATGTDVTFYITNNGALNFQNNNTRVTFSAPTSGTNEAMLIFQDRTDTHQANIQSGAITNLTGVIYIADALLNFAGGANSGSSAAYTIIVVKDLTLSGGSSYVNSDFSSLSGGNPIKGGVTLVE